MNSLFHLVFWVAFAAPGVLFGQAGAPRHVDTASYAILKYDTSNGNVPDGISRAKNATLTAEEVDAMEGLVERAYQEYNTKALAHWKLRALSNYKRQYLAYIDKNGNKLVWINCFCHDFGPKWRHQVLRVDDGGTCFFRFTINLTRKKPGKIAPNGIA